MNPVHPEGPPSRVRCWACAAPMIKRRRVSSAASRIELPFGLLLDEQWSFHALSKTLPRRTIAGNLQLAREKEISYTSHQSIYNVPKPKHTQLNCVRQTPCYDVAAHTRSSLSDRSPIAYSLPFCHAPSKSPAWHVTRYIL